jgi:hypothetical protein
MDKPISPESHMAATRTLVVGHSFVTRAKTFTEDHSMLNLNLSPRYHVVDFVGRGGAQIQDVLTLFAARPADPDLVIVDIGTNDLSGTISPISLANDLWDIAKTLLTTGVKRVILLGPVYRAAEGRHAAPDQFNEHVRIFNRALQMTIKGSSLPVHFWYHRGLSAQVTAYITDGVHLNSAGVQKYLRSLRRAVMRFTREWRNEARVNACYGGH